MVVGGRRCGSRGAVAAVVVSRRSAPRPRRIPHRGVRRAARPPRCRPAMYQCRNTTVSGAARSPNSVTARGTPSSATTVLRRARTHRTTSAPPSRSIDSGDRLSHDCGAVLRLPRQTFPNRCRDGARRWRIPHTRTRPPPQRQVRSETMHGRRNAWMLGVVTRPLDRVVCRRPCASPTCRRSPRRRSPVTPRPRCTSSTMRCFSVGRAAAHLPVPLPARTRRRARRLLLVAHGDPARAVQAVAKAVAAVAVHVSDFGPYGARRDEAVAIALGGANWSRPVTVRGGGGDASPPTARHMGVRAVPARLAATRLAHTRAHERAHRDVDRPGDQIVDHRHEREVALQRYAALDG